MRPASGVWLLAISMAALGQTRQAATEETQLAHANTDQRIKAYEKMMAAAPGEAHYEAGLISAYLQKLRETSDPGYLDRAAKLVDSMLETDGGDFIALRFQNEIDLQRHDFKRASERALDMAKYAPSDAGNWGNLGDASMELGQYEQAGRAYLKMFSLRPNLASYNRLAYFRFVTGDAAAAIGLMRNAVEAGDAAPENAAWCWAELGDMYFKTGQVGEAEKSYRTALSLFPTLHRASAGLGRVEAARGNLQAAILRYERAQSIVPLVEYAGALEDLYTATGRTSKAQGQRELISTIESLGRVANETTNRNLALLLADHARRLPFALRLVETELPVRSDVYTWDALAWVLFRNGRLEEAKAASVKALQFRTPEPVFYYHATKIAEATGDRVAADQYSERLVALNPKFDFAKARMTQSGGR